MAKEDEDEVRESKLDNTGSKTDESKESVSRLDQAKAFFRAMHAGEDLGQAGLAEPEVGITCPNCEQMANQLTELEKRSNEAENLYRRMAADFENYRRRIEREREEFQSFGIQKAVEALLPALDDMDRAQTSLNADTPQDRLIESLKLVFNRIGRSLEQLGVKPLTVVGEHFDPKYHEPVQEVETTEFADGVVVHELRRGYTLNDKVIRPALVNVASNQAGGKTAEDLSSCQAGVVDSSGKETEGKVYDLSEYEGLDDQDDNELADKTGSQ